MNKTFVVLGAPRCGTSMIAGLLRLMGINMGDNIKPDKHEDLDMFRADIPKLKQLIKIRNKKYNIWGWKDPWLPGIIHEIYHILRNPHFVCIFRDPMAAAQSDCRRNKNAKLEWSLNRANKFQTNIIDLIRSNKYPYSLISYETKLENPMNLILQLNKFLEVNLNNEQIFQCYNFINEKGYKAIGEEFEER